ncbi:hypothetical protein Tco_1197127 [Tanacetum coccineum]
MPLPPWRRADYVKAKRWVVEVMATANGYTIDDAIYRLTKLLRSLLNGRLARTIRTTSYEPATFPSLGKRKAHTELNFHGLQMHTQSIGRNLTPWFLGGCTLMMLLLALKYTLYIIYRYQARAFEDFDSLEDIPPATTIVSLVIYEASSDAKKAVAAAISSGVPSPLSGVFSLIAFLLQHNQ